MANFAVNKKWNKIKMKKIFNAVNNTMKWQFYGDWDKDKCNGK